MDNHLQDPSQIIVFTRLQLYDIMQQGKGDILKKLNYLENYLLNLPTNYEKDYDGLIKNMISFRRNFKTRWLAANRNHNRFRRLNSNWLQTWFTIPKVVCTTMRSEEYRNSFHHQSSSLGLEINSEEGEYSMNESFIKKRGNRHPKKIYNDAFPRSKGKIENLPQSKVVGKLPLNQTRNHRYKDIESTENEHDESSDYEKDTLKRKITGVKFKKSLNGSKMFSECTTECLQQRRNARHENKISVNAHQSMEDDASESDKFIFKRKNSVTTSKARSSSKHITQDLYQSTYFRGKGNGNKFIKKSLDTTKDQSLDSKEFFSKPKTSVQICNCSSSHCKGATQFLHETIESEAKRNRSGIIRLPLQSEEMSSSSDNDDFTSKETMGTATFRSLKKATKGLSILPECTTECLSQTTENGTTINQSEIVGNSVDKEKVNYSSDFTTEQKTPVALGSPKKSISVKSEDQETSDTEKLSIQQNTSVKTENPSLILKNLGTLSGSTEDIQQSKDEENEYSNNEKGHIVGRPPKSFDKLSDRSKRRRTEDLRRTKNIEELVYATQMQFRALGQNDAATILQNLVKHPDSAKKYLENVKEKNPPKSVLTILALYIEANLTKIQYEVIRTGAPKHFPPYKKLQFEKRACYPAADSYTITNDFVEINLQDLLDLTVKRLLISRKYDFQCKSLELVSSWRCDAAQFEDDNDFLSTIFLSSLVPLRLVYKQNDKIDTLWENPDPISLIFCRPIRILFRKGHTNGIEKEITYIQAKINTLKMSEIQIDEKVFVKHTLQPRTLFCEGNKVRDNYFRMIRSMFSNTWSKNIINKLLLNSDPLLIQLRRKSNTILTFPKDLESARQRHEDI